MSNVDELTVYENLHNALKNNDIDSVNTIYENKIDTDGFIKKHCSSPLVMAITKSCSVEIINTILKHQHVCFSSLYYALFHNRLDVIKLFIKTYGGILEFEKHARIPLLYYVLRYGNLDIIRFFINCDGVELNIMDDNRTTPLVKTP